MTDQQKHDILELYNHAVDDMFYAELRMDSDNVKIARRAGENFAVALARQETIARTLELLGYELICNDEDRAADIAMIS